VKPKKKSKCHISSYMTTPGNTPTVYTAGYV